MSTKQEFILLFQNTSWVMIEQNKLHSINGNGNLVLFYLVNGNNIAASVDADTLIINNKKKSIWNTCIIKVFIYQ